MVRNPKIKKKRRRLAAKRPKTVRAGEHLDRKSLEPIVEAVSEPDKGVKRWRAVVDSARFCYQIHFLTMVEVLDLHRRMNGEENNVYYSSFSSFSRAKEYLYWRVRSDIKILTHVADSIRKTRKSQYVDSASIKKEKKGQGSSPERSLENT